MYVTRTSVWECRAGPCIHQILATHTLQLLYGNSVLFYYTIIFLHFFTSAVNIRGSLPSLRKKNRIIPWFQFSAARHGCPEGAAERGRVFGTTKNGNGLYGAAQIYIPTETRTR
ncbi:hypothetical protein E2C01_073796 [Portunus trituberculatus]|uniref:Uncharacterized protein n=1 Tax=Portunus trituberculatus TaxID=210409 RepID=A0A5B7IEG9_PORTR|nr:hypothetical protein [Portunus trituberculatus]